MDKKWRELTWEEKREQRFQRWLNPENVAFQSSSAEKAYKERVNRLIKVIRLEKPDRVPVNISLGFFPAFYDNTTPETV
ncbi:MAG: hypothetical protein JRE40_14260, partial [Deltaproteobacteria bacterium]|nr:hypothetical protein [Deltaproteobacteria bacterium]